MGMFGPKPGSWSLRSESDPRWNCNGHCDAVGGFTMPEPARLQLEALRAQLGEPPADLYWTYTKD